MDNVKRPTQLFASDCPRSRRVPADGARAKESRKVSSEVNRRLK